MDKTWKDGKEIKIGLETGKHHSSAVQPKSLACTSSPSPSRLIDLVLEPSAFVGNVPQSLLPLFIRALFSTQHSLKGEQHADRQLVARNSGKSQFGSVLSMQNENSFVSVTKSYKVRRHTLLDCKGRSNMSVSRQINATHSQKECWTNFF